MQQRRVLDDQRVGLGDRLAGADRRVAEAAEGDDRRAGPLRAEAGKRLRVPPLVEGGDREQLGGGHHPLAAAAVDAHLERRSQPLHRDNVESDGVGFIRDSGQIETRLSTEGGRPAPGSAPKPARRAAAPGERALEDGDAHPAGDQVADRQRGQGAIPVEVGSQQRGRGADARLGEGLLKQRGRQVDDGDPLARQRQRRRESARSPSASPGSFRWQVLPREATPASGMWTARRSSRSRAPAVASSEGRGARPRRDRSAGRRGRGRSRRRRAPRRRRASRSPRRPGSPGRPGSSAVSRRAFRPDAKGAPSSSRPRLRRRGDGERSARPAAARAAAGAPLPGRR